MANFFDIVQAEYKTEYKMKKYTKPQIYKPKTGRWYVYFSYQHPSELNSLGRPKMIRFKCPTFGLNANCKTRTEKLDAFSNLREVVENVLKNGYSPFDKDYTSDGKYTTEAAIDYALSVKEKTISPKTYKDYENRSNTFKRYLKKRGMLNGDVKAINRALCINFLNEIASESSNRNRNNYRACLSAIFSLLEDEEYVDKNYFSTIKNLKTTPKAHKIYTKEQVEQVFNAIKDDTPLRLYILMVSYGFLRPVEACRLQVKDIDLQECIWTIDAKNKKGKRKRIPDILMKELLKLDLSNPNAYILTLDGVAESEISAEQRRKTFTDHYKIIRDKLGFDKEHDVYSFRHYFTTKVYNELRKEYSYTKALDILQSITGHQTREALMKYLRSIDAEIPADYSDLLKP
ncbi:tyrosine-type recombinase/integrase [Ornithobacterium rhinotracheale]|uniref:tyrosine-type recombinase/integrase n=1 Tax=Ornithobacterium rhinotracheale TaxID=28251 RepID=UPI001FF428D8|nr:tyrosine-type recombinase/integrase [Ornithobacterium rhinotracheale]MCK0201384.1 tyrosine-type recombinase/integrase [Ornithobacterium rhinotracheale]